MYDSQGEAGSYKEIMFASEFDDQSFMPKTPSPTQAPTLTTENEIFGVSCGGICPGSFSQVANAQQVVSIGRNGGTEYYCGSLDKRYQQLFSTPDACEALQVSAQQAGCQCEATAGTGTQIGQVTNSATAETSTKRETLNESQPLEIQWGLILGVVGAVGIAGCCCCKYAGKRQSEETDGVANVKVHDVESVDATGRESIGDDETANSGSDESGDMSDGKDESRPLPLQRVKSAFAITQNHAHQVLPLRRVRTAMSPSVVPENDFQRILPVRRVQSSISSRFLQSWQLTMPEGDTDKSESVHPFDEDGFEICADGQFPKDNVPDLMSPQSNDDSLDSLVDPQPNLELNLSNCSDSDGSALIMSV